ncbi:hypothetical protein NI17_013310 [Thermobifida halotolerans]|uniref:Uncharacterized protein n=1 Tax=Thermobifida halotolerans TaxID=483545 RepID=A0A399G1T3_9ACTN|nr:hypothetical protein [Thermobifida halotolerans]UOE17861.1 hypothetical protein NI17_013310 [Thermobifida halotolerans]
MGETRRRALLRGTAALGGVAVVSTAAVVGGLLWDARGPAVEAASTDAHPVPPACASVPAEAVGTAVPGAVLESDTAGPLPLSATRSCVWSSVDVPDAEPRTLTVSFRAHFGDADGRVSGAERARAEVEALGPGGEGRGVLPVASLGEDALTRPAASVGDAVEVVFRDGNLTVRVCYGGVPADEARAGAVAVAEELAATL